MSAKVHMVATETPDLPLRLDGENIYKLYERETFRVRDQIFVRTKPGEYKCGNAVVYCDQQGSTSWACKVGAMRTGYYWTPEAAVLAAFPEAE